VAMILVTMAFGYWLVAYHQYEKGREDQLRYSRAKSPLYFGITKDYTAILVSNASTWNTTDQLGIVFFRNQFNSSWYDVLIEDQDKIQWMEAGETPYVKYNDKYYHLEWLWVTPGLDLEYGRIAGGALGLAMLWVILIIVAFVNRFSEKRKR